MTPLVVIISYAMSIGTVVLHLALLVFIVGTFISPVWREWLHERVGRHGALVALGIVAMSLVGSLFYSMVAGFSACIVCWIVRAFMYPQIIALAAYYHKPHRWMLITSLVMSIGATLASVYQVLLLSGGTIATICGAIPGLGDCTVEYFRIFGYINIATMSLTAAVALVVCQAVALHRKHWMVKEVAS